MNNVLELKGKRFIQASRNNKGGGPSINTKEIVKYDKLIELKLQLVNIKKFWEEEKRPFDGILISVFYNKIVAKSNRIAGLFKGKDSSCAIVGAKFTSHKDKHIITYYLDLDDLTKSIDLLENASYVLKSMFQDGIDSEIFNNTKEIEKIDFKKLSIKKTIFKQVIADVSYIDHFAIEETSQNLKQNIITLYKTNIDMKKLLKDIGINILKTRILNNQTVYLDEQELQILFDKIPYLVSMSTEDLLELSPEDFRKEQKQEKMRIDSPTVEPIIGVIDTLFDTRVYFSEWVEYYDKVDQNIPRTSDDYKHGTAVTSIIVDGARLNPWLDDGCGNFRVRHFGVSIGSKFSSFNIIKQIKEIIMKHRDIKVWNISLGSNQEINDNFISTEAAILDQIQYENDVIFVVAGTNKGHVNINKIGSPADSINSIVVNSVTKSGLATEYSRKGLALSFFSKPDVSYYGGSKEKYIKVCEPLGEAHVAGTSFAAPWIARKLAYLIDILGLNREIAKALIIDSARGWDEKPTMEEIALYGHGIVPIKIDDIIQTKEDEIKFLVSDISEKWNSYNYDFPVPIVEEKYPYVARATMCYFPMCERTQGVDYTNTELNLHFGRIDDKGKVLDIKGDNQNQTNLLDGEQYLLESQARNIFRKWDNVKYIVEKPTERKKAKKSYNYKKWGMEVKTNNRLDPKDGIGIRFGIVVTLKEINGVNRIDEFIKNCTLQGWLVTPIDIHNRIDIHQKMDEEIVFES